MASAIHKVSMGVSATAAATNQNCVSERLSIGDDVPRKRCVGQTRREKSSDAIYILHTPRPVSVVAGVTNTSDCFFFLAVFDIDLREMPINVHSY